MPPHQSQTPLLVLHAVRLLGMAATSGVAQRFGIPVGETAELLEDFRACGWVSHTTFAGAGGWSLTAAGVAANNAQLRAELDDAGARAVVASSHEQFLALNARFQRACTDWQLRPQPGDPLVANDHSDSRWDDRVLAELAVLGGHLRPITEPLAASLARFSGYPERYGEAMGRVVRGQRSYVDGVGLQSCHAIWFQLHEDLLATLGLDRGQERTPNPGQIA